MTSKFGKTDWDQDTAKPRGNFAGTDGKKDVWMKLVPGSNILRFVTEPFAYELHKYKVDPEDKKDFGQKIPCSLAIHKQCPLCAIGDKIKQRWYVGVIDVKAGVYKILDISSVVYDQVKKLNRNEYWGDPALYDVDVNMDPKASSPAGWYTVTPLGKNPLTEAQVALKASADLDALARRCTPPAPKYVLERVNNLRKEKNMPPLEMAAAPAETSTVKAAAPVSAPVTTAVVDNTPDDDDNMEFPVAAES